MKILANDGISQSGIDKLAAAGIEVITSTVDQDNLIDYINDNQIVGLMVRSATKVRKDLIDACPNLKLIGRGGVGMDNIDVEYARSVGRTVFNTPAASSQSVAELVMTHIFSISRSVFDSNRNMPSKGDTEFKVLKKKYGKGSELRGKTLGVIGFGRIGRSTAQYALGCGMKVIATDKFATNSTVELNIEGHGSIEVNVPMVPMDELLTSSDIVTLHIPKQEDGSAVINATNLGLMKKGAMIVNAARGGVIDEDALINALDSGQLRYAALDVFENEPTPRKDLMEHASISLTPHIGAATSEAQDRIGVELADQIIEGLS